MSRKIIAIVMALTMILTLAACGSSQTPEQPGTEPAAAQPQSTENNAVTIRFSEESTDEHPLTQGAMKFKELLEAADVNITVEVFPNATIANEMAALEMCQLGTLEMTMCSTSTFANFVNAYNVFDLAYMITDEDVADNVLLGDFGNEMLAKCTDANMVGLSFWENGFRNLTTNVEINSIEDFKGLKIRTMENAMHMAAWKTVGTDPTPMAFTELYTALQQNVVDGQENPYANIVLNSFYDVQKYFYTTRHVYTPMLIVMSQDFWKTLSAEQQEAVKQAAYDSGLYERKVNRELNEQYAETLKANMNYVEISDELRAQLREHMTTVAPDFADIIGADVLEAYQKAIEACMS